MHNNEATHMMLSYNTRTIHEWHNIYLHLGDFIGKILKYW